MKKKVLRKIGVGILGITMGCVVAIMVSSTVLAGSGMIGTPPGGTGGGNILGVCNKDRTWCWNIDINPPLNNYPKPIEVHGHRAKNLITHGEIYQANLSSYGVFYLRVWSNRYGREFDCTVNFPLRHYRCRTNQ